MYQNNMQLKSFSLKPPTKSTKVYNIMQDYCKKLVVLAKNKVKQKMYISSKKVGKIKLNLRNFSLEYYCVFIQNVTDNSGEKGFKMKKQVIDKYNSFLDK